MPTRSQGDAPAPWWRRAGRQLTTARVALVAAVTFGAALVGPATGALRAWTEMRSAERVAFLTAVAAEREYYEDAYRLYASGQPRASEAIFAALNARTPPRRAFDDLSYGVWRQEAPMRSIDDCQSLCRPGAGCREGLACVTRHQRIGEINQLGNALRTLVERDVSPDTRAEYVRRQFVASETDAIRRTEDGSRLAPVEPAATTVAAEALSVAAIPTTAAVLADNNPEGFDVDVFWCASATPDRLELARYEQARRLAEALSIDARTARPLASGVALGRVRLRPLLYGRQQNPDYNRTENSVIFSRAVRGEEGAADALVAFARLRAGTALQKMTAGDPYPTPYYLSVFVCDGVQPRVTSAGSPAGRPPPPGPPA